MDVDHRHQKNGDDDGRVPGGRKRLPAWKTEKQERTERLMSWEFEDLFNNKRTGDGGFLEEPCFIPVGSMGYRRRTTVSGPRIDAEVFPVFGRQMRGALRRARTGNGTVDAQKKANAERSRIRLIQLVEANFTDQDLAIGLDYDGKTPTPERIDKDLTNFFAKVRRRRRTRGLPDLKYILAIGGDEMPAAGYSGKRPHVHVIMNGGIDRDELEQLWGHGHANTHRLQPRDSGLGGIATYFTKQMQDRPPKMGVKRYRPSRNLTQPVRRARDAKMPNSRVRRIAYDFENQAKEIMEKLYPGYVLQETVVKHSDYVPGVYIRCVLRKMKGGGGM